MIIDIVLIILIVIALIYGIYKGFAGVLLGFVGTIIIAVLLGVGVLFLLPSVMYKDKSTGVTIVNDENGASLEGYTDFFMLLYNPISEKLLGLDDELMNAELVDVDGILQLKVKGETEGEYEIVKFSVALKELVPFFNSKEKEEDSPNVDTVSSEVEGNEQADSDMLDKYITYFGCAGGMVAQAIAATITIAIYAFAIWFVALILAVIIKAIIRRFIFRALDRHSVASKIDRAIGAVVTVAVVVCVAWLIVSAAVPIVNGFGLEENLQKQLDVNPILNFIANHSMFGGTVQTPSAGDENLIFESIAGHTHFDYRA